MVQGGAQVISYQRASVACLSVVLSRGLAAFGLGKTYKDSQNLLVPMAALGGSWRGRSAETGTCYA